jgi:hypothetical protein
MMAHRVWLKTRYPLSKRWLPGRDTKKDGHLDKAALVHGLLRLHRVYLQFRETEKDLTKFPNEPYLAKKYTAHGAGRAFYIFVRRSQGADDPLIAHEVNHTGGISTLQSVYALAPDWWKEEGKRPNLSWLPKGKPAWFKIKRMPGLVLLC